MRKRFLIVPGVLVAAALVVLAAMPSSQHLPASAPTARVTTSAAVVPAPGTDVAALDHTDTESAIEAHLALVEGQGIDAQAALDASLARLRAHGAETVASLTDLYDASASDAYLRRWSLLHLATSLHDGHTIDLLTSVVHAPFPEDPRSEAFEQEAMIHMRAIEGLFDLARHGDASAQAALRACVASCPAPLRPSIVQAALLAGGPPEVRAQIASALPPQDRWMLDQRVGDLATDGASPAPADDGRHAGSTPTTIPAL